MEEPRERAEHSTSACESKPVSAPDEPTPQTSPAESDPAAADSVPADGKEEAGKADEAAGSLLNEDFAEAAEESDVKALACEGGGKSGKTRRSYSMKFKAVLAALADEERQRGGNKKKDPFITRALRRKFFFRALLSSGK